MRNWAGPIGFAGAAASLVFWLAAPFAGGVFAGGGYEALAIVLAAMSAAGIAGALIAGGSSRLSPALLAVAIIPAVAALLALAEPERPIAGGLSR